jgi:uncharacterized repeat protein (TIGR01451 family)
VTCTATYETTQADLDAGQVDNTATATATPPEGVEAPVSAPDSAKAVTDADGALALDKTARGVDVDHDGRLSTGDRIEWMITVTNTGPVKVSGIVVADPTAGTVTCPGTVLDPGASFTCTAPAHLITAADAQTGEVVNTATVTGTGPGGPITPASGTAEIAIDLIERPVPSEPPAPGQPGPGQPGPGDELPNTGGPSLLILLAGLTVTVLGTGLLARQGRDPRREGCSG